MLALRYDIYIFIYIYIYIYIYMSLGFESLRLRHDRGTAWEPHGHDMLCVNRP